MQSVRSGTFSHHLCVPNTQYKWHVLFSLMIWTENTFLVFCAFLWVFNKSNSLLWSVYLWILFFFCFFFAQFRSLAAVRTYVCRSWINKTTAVSAYLCNCSTLILGIQLDRSFFYLSMYFCCCCSNLLSTHLKWVAKAYMSLTIMLSFYFWIVHRMLFGVLLLSHSDPFSNVIIALIEIEFQGKNPIHSIE